MKIENIMWMQIKLEMLNVVAKWGGSEPVDTTFNCFSFVTLDSLRVFSMAFTLSAFAVVFASVFVNLDISFSLFLTSMSFFSLFMSFFDFILSYWL